MTTRPGGNRRAVNRRAPEKIRAPGQRGAACDRADEQPAALLRVVAPAVRAGAGARRAGAGRPRRDGALFAHTDFMSADGMQTAIFGPAFWFTIHLVS